MLMCSCVGVTASYACMQTYIVIYLQHLPTFTTHTYNIQRLRVTMQEGVSGKTQARKNSDLKHNYYILYVFIYNFSQF